MSVNATRFAWECDLSKTNKRSAKRLVLLALADRANKENTCFPSIARVVKDTGMDRKTVMNTINDLIDLGLVTDTGERRGGTNQVRVLKINVDGVSLKQESYPQLSQKTPNKQCEISQTTVPNLPSKSTEFPLNSTKSGTRNLKQSKKETKIESLEVENCEEGCLTTQTATTKFLPREVWIEQQRKLGKWVDYQQPANNNKEMVVSASMKKSFDEGFSNPNAVKGIPQELLNKLPAHLRKRVVK